MQLDKQRHVQRSVYSGHVQFLMHADLNTVHQFSLEDKSSFSYADANQVWMHTRAEILTRSPLHPEELSVPHGRCPKQAPACAVLCTQNVLCTQHDLQVCAVLCTSSALRISLVGWLQWSSLWAAATGSHHCTSLPLSKTAATNSHVRIYLFLTVKMINGVILF